MDFERKMPVRGLHPVTGSHAPDFIGHLLLPLKITDMLNDAVGEGQIERTILEHRHIASIPLHPGDSPGNIETDLQINYSNRCCK